MPGFERTLFWRKALLLGAVLLAVAGWLEMRLRQMPTLYHQKRDGLRAAAPTLQVLILGASQANQGLDPSLWPVPAYNLGCVGQDAYYDWELFMQKEPDFAALETLVLPISYVSFGSSLAESPETWRSFAYKQTFGILNELAWSDFAYAWDLRNWSALCLVEPWPALKLAWNGFVDPNAPKLNAQGFEAVEPWDPDSVDLHVNDLLAAKRAQYHQGILKEGNWERNKQRYEQLAEAMALQGRSALFVVFPVYPAYAKALDPDLLRRRSEILAALTKDGKAKLLDYFRDKRFEDSDFMDVDHLNKKGAAKFSKILWEEGLKPKR